MPSNIDRLEYVLVKIGMLLAAAHQIKLADSKKDLDAGFFLLRPAESKQGLTGKTGATVAKRLFKNGISRNTTDSFKGPNRKL